MDFDEFKRLFRAAAPAMGPGFIFANYFATSDVVVQTVQQRMGLVPQLEDDVVVEVTGQPGATKQQLYFAALATANGIVRRFGDLYQLNMPAYGAIVIEYDAADHWVRCTISYKWSMAAVVAEAPAGAAAPTISTVMDRMAVYRGPQCSVVGGDFDFLATGSAVPVSVGIPSSSLSPDAPQLPLRNNMILTACPETPTPAPTPISQKPAPFVPVFPSPVIPSPNPKPPGDNRSRGAVIVPGNFPGGTPVPGPTPTENFAKCCDKLRALVPLVYAALSAPATNSDMFYPTPGGGPTGG